MNRVAKMIREAAREMLAECSPAQHAKPKHDEPVKPGGKLRKPRQGEMSSSLHKGTDWNPEDIVQGPGPRLNQPPRPAPLVPASPWWAKHRTAADESIREAMKRRK